MDKIIALIGFSSSGKDSIARLLQKDKWCKIAVSHTTRPMRSNEVQDNEYHFISNDVMDCMINNNDFIEYREYNTIQDGEKAIWKYGLSKYEVNLDLNNYVVCVDLQGCNDLKSYFGNDKIISIFIAVPYEDRKLRAIIRDKNFDEDEFERRYKDDLNKLDNIIQSVDYVIENIDLTKCYNKVICAISNKL